MDRKHTDIFLSFSEVDCTQYTIYANADIFVSTTVIQLRNYSFTVVLQRTVIILQAPTW